MGKSQAVFRKARMWRGGPALPGLLAIPLNYPQPIQVLNSVLRRWGEEGEGGRGALGRHVTLRDHINRQVI
jgi:hypothetical protein